MTLYRTIQAGHRGILILAFFAVHWSAKAPAATSCGHIRFMAGHGAPLAAPCLDHLCHLVYQAEPGAQEERRNELWRHGQASQVDDDAP